MSDEILVVGAGPAGMSAALWLRDLELPFRWVEASPNVGGTLLRVGNVVDNLIGVPAMPGHELAAALAEDCVTRGLRCELDSPVAAVRRHGDTWTAELPGAPLWSGPVVLLCTGTKPRMLGLSAERTHLGRGVEISVTRTRARYRGTDTVVVGGGDAALEGAILLAHVARTVTIVHRRPELGGQSRFVDRLRAMPNVTFVLGAAVAEIETRGDTVAGVVLDDGRRIGASGVFVRIGVIPSVPFGAEGATGADGYVSADPSGRTVLPGIYAAGDLVSREHQSVSWAIGSAGRAVRAIHDDHFAGV